MCVCTKISHKVCERAVLCSLGRRCTPADRCCDLRVLTGLGPEVIVAGGYHDYVRIGAKLFSAGAFSVVRGVLVTIVFGGTSAFEGGRIYPRIYPFTADANGRLQQIAVQDDGSTGGYRESGEGVSFWGSPQKC
jgi:hypothetical protein